MKFGETLTFSSAEGMPYVLRLRAFAEAFMGAGAVTDRTLHRTRRGVDCVGARPDFSSDDSHAALRAGARHAVAARCARAPPRRARAALAPRGRRAARRSRLGPRDDLPEPAYAFRPCRAGRARGFLAITSGGSRPLRRSDTRISCAPSAARSRACPGSRSAHRPCAVHRVRSSSGASRST